MKNLYKLLIPAIFLFTFSCTTTENNYVARVKLQSLKESEMYDGDKVFDVLFDSEELNTDSLKINSRELFLKGVDNFRNKKDPKSSISFFKKSILILPDAKAYYELGNALLETAKANTDYEEVLKAYDVAEQLDFQPISLIYFKKASAQAALKQKDDDWWSVRWNLLRAFETGFTDTISLKSDRHLVDFLKTDDYQNMLRAVIVTRLAGQPDGLFSLFKNSFPLITTAFEVSPEQVDMSNYKQTISYEFARFIPEMESSRFGRDVSHEFYFVAKLIETPSYVALIYTSASYFGGDMPPVHTKLITYTPSGEIISGKLFAGRLSAESVKAGFFENGKITIRDYNVLWEQPIDKVSFEENKIKKHDLAATAVFSIDENGKIIEESVPANFKDSAIIAKQ
jgi:hypothetical protein